MPLQVSQPTEVGTLMVFCTPLIGFFQRYPQVIAQVRSALCARAAAAAAAATHEIAEQVFEHVGKRRCEIALAAEPAAARRRRTAAFKRRMAVAVIGGFFVGVFQHVIGLVHFLELGFGVGIVGVAVGVKFFGLGAIGFFQLFRRSPFGRPRTS